MEKKKVKELKSILMGQDMKAIGEMICVMDLV